MARSTTSVVPRRYESQQAAADRLSVSVDTVRRMIAVGDLTAYRLNGRTIRVDAGAVDALLKPIPAGATITAGGAR